MCETKLKYWSSDYMFMSICYDSFCVIHTVNFNRPSLLQNYFLFSANIEGSVIRSRFIQILLKDKINISFTELFFFSFFLVLLYPFVECVFYSHCCEYSVISLIETEMEWGDF